MVDEFKNEMGWRSNKINVELLISWAREGCSKTKANALYKATKVFAWSSEYEW